MNESATDSRRAMRRNGKKKLSVKAKVFIVIGSILAVLLAAGGVLYAIALNTYNGVERVSIVQDPTLTRPPETEYDGPDKAPINILLLGSDTREGLDTETTSDELTDGGSRSDVIIVAQISPDREHVTFMSIMRDNLVEIQGHGEEKINHAFSYGGAPLMVNTVENFIGARIDHVAIVDFESFAGMTDALGGVTIDNQNEFHNINGAGLTGKRYPFYKGKITLTGDQAIAYVRERYSFSDGDFTRVRNQQTFMKGLMKQMLSAETLTSPQKITSVFEALKPYLILDQGLDMNTAMLLGLEMSGIRSSGMQFFTSPTNGGAMVGDEAVVLPRWDDIAKIQEAFQEGTLHEYAAELPERSEIKPAS